MNRSNFREDIAGTRKLIEKTWNKKYKSRSDLFWKHHRNKILEELYSSKLLKENPSIPRTFLSNYIGKETPEEKEMQNLTKEKVGAELQSHNIRYERKL